ncbi:MAG: sporulation protein YunB [Dehalobacterium sp.]
MRKKDQKKVVYLFITFLIIGSFLFFLDLILRPAIIKVAESKTQLMATKIINEAVQKNVSMINYQELVGIHKDNDNRVVLMMPDIVLINRIATQTIIDIEMEFEKMETQGFSLPLGLVTGSTLFSNTGPHIRIGITPVGMIDVNMKDEFIEAGINQTKHRIYLNVKTNLQIVVPFLRSDVNVAVDVPITESIIVGPIPEWYMKFNSPGEMIVPGINPWMGERQLN